MNHQAKETNELLKLQEENENLREILKECLEGVEELQEYQDGWEDVIERAEEILKTEE